MMANGQKRTPQNLETALEKDCVSLRLAGESKQEIIEELIDLMVKAGKLDDRQTALAAVRDREAKMSTGMQFGVAIPHGKTASVGRLVAAFGLKPEGVDLGSLDGEPSRIFLMTVAPEDWSGPHLQYLAEVSRLLKEEAVRGLILAAATEEDILGILAG